jgi:uncharacterized membrane protein
MLMLMAACATFLGLHIIVSGTRLRPALTRRIGKTAYLGVFATAALASLVWICCSYGPAFSDPENFFVFDPCQTWRNGALPVIGFAFLLGVPGVLMMNPTSAGQETAPLKGVQKITRHPFLWCVAIWAGFHLIGSGDLASTILFSTFLLLAILGTRSIDAKCRKRLGEDSWLALKAKSSNIPFAALLTGRNTLKAKEYIDWRFAVALADFLLFLYFHNDLFGMSPFPNAWLPSF